MGKELRGKVKRIRRVYWERRIMERQEVDGMEAKVKALFTNCSAERKK